MGGGGSSPAPAPTQQTVTQTNIPEYAQPYVESMLGATQQQLFNTTTNPDGSIQITGVKPYQPYSTNPSDYIAPFSPLQNQAMQSVANLQVPQQYQQAMGMTGQAAGAAAGATGNMFNLANTANPQDFQQNVGGYMNPYIQNALSPALQLANQQYGIAGTQQAGQATGAGAFGGTRSALQQGLNAQNQMLAQNQLIGNAYNQAFNAAQNQYNQSGQFALNANQAALQGAGQYGNLANQLAGLGSQQLAAQQGIAGLQNQYGAQQQAQQQNIINQAIQNYATAQQYPEQQLAFMNAQLRGLPLQTSTVQGYQAAPSPISQIAGLGTAGIAGLGLYNAMNPKQ